MENFLPSHNDWREGTRYSHYHRVFQIDAIFGISAAITEMLITSCDGSTVLLPCLPKAMQKEGSVRGLHVYHGVTYDMQWQDGIVTALTVHAEKNMELFIRCGLSGIPEAVYPVRKGTNKIV